MSVDPVKFDNPLRRDSLPIKPMTFGFVPRALPLVDGLWASSGFVLIAVYAFIGICMAMATLLLANSFGSFVAIVASQQRICIVILAGAVVYRVTNYQTDSFATILVIASLNGISQAAVVVTHADPGNSLLLAYLLLLTIWTVAEIAIHYSSINRQLVHLSDVKIQDEYENSLSALTLITIIGSLFYFVFLFGGRGLLGTAIVAFVYAVVAFEKAATKSKKPFRFLFCAINNYLQYPDGADCAPGLIRTNSGKQVHRPACIALLTIGLGCVPIVFYGQSPTIPGLLIWEAISLAYVLTVVTLAAAFSAQRQHFPTTNVPFGSIVNHLRNSENEHENKTYFWGRVVADLSPIIFNRDIAFQHIHILGTTGSGKSALRLAPMIEQTIGFGDMSLIVIDLKADRLESLASCMAAIKDLKQRTGIEMPIKVFTITQGDMSHIFNPFSFVGWTRLSIADKTSIVAEALNLFYGTDWSRGHFSSVNSDIIQACIIANPKIASFRELYQTLCDLAADKSTIIGSQRRENYIHVAQSLQKLASCNVLNGTAQQGCSEFELDEGIDLDQAFQVPCVYYFHLPSITSPYVAQSVARIVTKFLLVSAKSAERKVKVQVIIDEFQRMVSENLDGLFQLARSHDISLVIANQSLGDLRSTGDKLIQAIEGNCAVRQWLSVNSAADLDLVAKLFGTHKEVQTSHTSSTNGSSVTQTLRDAPRITMTDLHQISDNPHLSITQITGVRSGYAQYGGIPFVVRSEFHISEEEYAKRKAFNWPTDLPGMVEVDDLPPPQVQSSNRDPRPPRPGSSPKDTSQQNRTPDFTDLFS